MTLPQPMPFFSAAANFAAGNASAQDFEVLVQVIAGVGIQTVMAKRMEIQQWNWSLGPFLRDNFPEQMTRRANFSNAAFRMSRSSNPPSERLSATISPPHA